MKKNLLCVFLLTILVFGITSRVWENHTIRENELNDINDKIIAYFSSNHEDYDNFVGNYVDVENKKVVVLLLDNGKEQQEQFRKSVVDSKLIDFVQGSENINFSESIDVLELNKLQEMITSRISFHSNYSNFASCGVDKVNLVVDVELIDNSKEQQEWFRKHIINSKYIHFTQGGPYVTSNEKCFENLLGGYITSEFIIPKEGMLSDIIKVDMEKVDYSKVKITDNGLIYVMVKTSDTGIEQDLDTYFNRNYNGYQKANFPNDYFVYVYNGLGGFHLEEDLKVCMAS